MLRKRVLGTPRKDREGRVKIIWQVLDVSVEIMIVFMCGKSANVLRSWGCPTEILWST